MNDNTSQFAIKNNDSDSLIYKQNTARLIKNNKDLTGLLADVEISRLAIEEDMISPFVDHSVKVNEKGERVLSYGLSSGGYDFTLADEFMIFTNTYGKVLDPKGIDEGSFVRFKGDVCLVPPNSFVLGRTKERIKMPRDVMAMCLTKSTYARVGLFCVATPAEPGWEGYLTLEFANLTSLPAKLYAHEGAFQMVFFRLASPCKESYADRGGKYQNQGEEITLPKV
jgi:dCTP deaminase